MPWTLDRSTRFKRRYGEKSAEDQQKVDEAIRKLVASTDPRTLGSAKSGSLAGCYGHDIDYHSRILYSVDMTNRIIHFLRVCSHEEAYGPSGKR